MRAATPTEANAEPRERVLGGITRVLRIPEDMRGESTDPRCVACAQGLEGPAVSVFCASDENGVTQSIVGKWCLGPQGRTDSTPRAQ